MKEVWKDVPGFCGFYLVSNLGRVKSLNRYVSVTLPTGRTYQRRVRERIRKHSLGGGVPGRRYPIVSLCGPTGKVTAYYIHALVWVAFSGCPIPKGLEVNHKDGNKKNNKLSNLEVGTRSHNTRHAMRMGLSKIHFKGSRNPGAVLTESRVKKIKEDLRQGGCQAAIARREKVCPQTITLIKQGKTWTHVK